MNQLTILQLSTPELRQLLREELAAFLTQLPQPLPVEIPPSPEAYLTVKEVAERLQLAKSTIYDLTSEQKIPHYKRGKRVYFLESEINAWVKSGRRKTQEEIQVEARQRIGDKISPAG